MTLPAEGRLTVELAGLRRRLASMLYEVLLLLGVLGLTFMVPMLIVGVVWHVTPPGWFEWLYIFAVLAGYFIWYWRRGGQTLAMQTWRLKLVDAATGCEVSRAKGLLRYALAWPSVLTGLGLVWALFDDDRQFLHDRLAGSRIVLMPPVKH
ncbi:MAG: RDD family protein [Rhodocyclaceae bacterium]|nr:RDD family protein [Rhodocyclaceae bacterium]